MCFTIDRLKWLCVCACVTFAVCASACVFVSWWWFLFRFKGQKQPINKSPELKQHHVPVCVCVLVYDLQIEDSLTFSHPFQELFERENLILAFRLEKWLGQCMVKAGIRNYGLYYNKTIPSSQHPFITQYFRAQFTSRVGPAKQQTKQS